MYVCVYKVCMYVRMHVSMYIVCMYVCTYVCVYVCNGVEGLRVYQHPRSYVFFFAGVLLKIQKSIGPNLADHLTMLN